MSCDTISLDAFCLNGGRELEPFIKALSGDRWEGKGYWSFQSSPLSGLSYVNQLVSSRRCVTD